LIALIINVHPLGSGTAAGHRPDVG
jgi:hypothetical protein